uniref:Tpd52 like 2a n=1 Tax=Gouania willdenowi TaxID=441366 RepID=A0A8C5EP43_GOUWI
MGGMHKGFGASSSLYFSTRITGNGHSPSGLTDEDIDHLRFQLAKTEEEIYTLRQALFGKEKYAAEIRRQLGLGPLSSIKQNLSKGWQEVQTSTPYVTARDGLSHAGQVTTAALSTVGVAITKRFTEMRYPSNNMSIHLSIHPTTIHIKRIRNPVSSVYNFYERVGKKKLKVFFIIVFGEGIIKMLVCNRLDMLSPLIFLSQLIEA